MLQWHDPLEISSRGRLARRSQIRGRQMPTTGSRGLKSHQSSPPGPVLQRWGHGGGLVRERGAQPRRRGRLLLGGEGTSRVRSGRASTARTGAPVCTDRGQRLRDLGHGGGADGGRRLKVVRSFPTACRRVDGCDPGQHAVLSQAAEWVAPPTRPRHNMSPATSTRSTTRDPIYPPPSARRATRARLSMPSRGAGRREPRPERSSDLRAKGTAKCGGRDAARRRQRRPEAPRVVYCPTWIHLARVRDQPQHGATQDDGDLIKPAGREGGVARPRIVVFGGRGRRQPRAERGRSREGGSSRSSTTAAEVGRRACFNRRDEATSSDAPRQA